MRKQALPPFPVFKKPLPCCPVLGLSIPFPLSVWWSNILEQCSSQLLTPRGTMSPRPAGFGVFWGQVWGQFQQEQGGG